MNNDIVQPPPVPVETSLASRLTNVFIAPGEVFEEIKSRPVRHANWLVAGLVFVLLSWCGNAVKFSQESVRHEMAEIQGQAMQKSFQKQIDAGKMTQAHLNAVDRWLLSNAAEEAESRGDDFNALPFRRALESKTIPQADKDSAEMYLFEWQPDVIKPITRPLVPESKSPPVAANETATDAPQAPLGSAEAPQASDDDRKADLEKRRSDL